MTEQEQVNESIDHLALIAEMSKKFSNTQDINDILQRALELIVEHLGAEAASVFLLDEEKNNLICRACVGPINILGLSVPAKDKSIIGCAVSEKVSKLVKDTSKDPNFGANVDKETGFITKSILCSPLQVGDNCLGAVEVINKKAGSQLFNKQDKDLLEALSSSGALAILNARMAKELIEQEAVRKELELAAEIQRGLIPEHLPEDFPVHGINVPARKVSGDFFDAGELEDGKIWFNLGDVSGKGMNAALLMAKTSSLFRCLAKTEKSPGKLLAIINNELCDTNSKGMFVTMTGGFFNPATGELCFANAGHEPPVLYNHQTQEFESFPALAPPLGIAKEVVGKEGFPEEKIDMNFGSFYIFTDGFTEAETAKGELGEEGTKEILKEASNMPVFKRPSYVLSKLNEIKARIHDDITFLTVSHNRKIFSLRIKAEPENLKTIRSKIEKSAILAGFETETAADIVLAVDEACQNIIRHAYCEENHCEEKDIIVETMKKDNNFIIRLIDFAPEVDETKIKPRDYDDIRPGGLGTAFISEIMDKTEFKTPPEGAGNLFEMTKEIRKP